MATISTISNDVGGNSDNGSLTAGGLEISAEQEFCLYELETTDSTSVGLVLRAIYDSGDVHKFVRALERRITHYDKNILKVCTYHYQEFLDSVKQLINLTDKCSEIKKMAQNTDDYIQNDSKKLINKTAEIVRYRRLQRNANLAIDQISICLPALELYSNLQKLMENNKYLQALKLLEDLEHNYLSSLQKYRFAVFLTESISPIRNEIRSKSYSELTDFLEHLQKASRKIGEDATRHTIKKFKMFETTREKLVVTDELKNLNNSDNVELSSDGSILLKNANQNIDLTINKTGLFESKLSTKQDEIKFSALDKIDYSPIHRCCQIFNVLGDKERFEVYYRKQRQDQASVLIQTPIKSESQSAYIRYLDEIIGFFIVEDCIMQCQPSLVTASHKDQLWKMALHKISLTMNSSFGNCLDVEMMLKMKEIILQFILTMKSYSYNIAPLYLLLQNFRDQYNEILMREYCTQFENALNADNYTPISVSTETEYKTVIEEFPVFKRNIDRDYNYKFPFSQFVPTVFTQAKNYLMGCLRFMENLQLSHSEINDTVRRYANVLLARWSGSLKIFVSSKKPSLTQLIQIIINLGYLERSCEHLEHYISKIVNQDDRMIESGHLITLRTQTFRGVCSDVEQLIDEALIEKVHAFLEIANYNWDLAQPTGMASDYIMDLINFFKTIFTSFNNLPNALARHLCMQTFKYLADSLHQMLIGSEVKAISTGALDQFNLDVIQCEQFIAQCPVTDLDYSALSITFAHVRQLLNLVMDNDWTTYLAERGKRNCKYSRVKASSAVTLLEKLIEYEKRNSGFFGISRGDRKKLYDTILRNLRALND